MTNRYPEIDGAMAFIHRQLDGELTLSYLARHVGYSPYHFVRLFKERIGLAPMQYVSALRLQRAKELLLQTDLPIREVGLEIGQQSLGTFTTRFTQRVGVTPAQFRQSPLQVSEQMRALQRLDDWRERSLVVPGTTITGSVQVTVPFAGMILIGLFAKPIPEGLPLYGTLLPGPGPFRMAGVRPGIYYLMATALDWQLSAADVLLPHGTLRTRAHKPLLIRSGYALPPQEVLLYPPALDDPPILISLPLLIQRFLGRVSQERNL